MPQQVVNISILFGLVMLISVPAAGQQRPLVTTGGPQVNTGIPAADIGLHHQSYLAPGVGAVVGLAHGFPTPNFSYSYMHPLSAYSHPLRAPGAYGGYTGAPSHTVVHHYIPHPTSTFNSTAEAAEAERPPASTDLVRPLELLPNPWHGGSSPVAGHTGPTLYQSQGTSPEQRDSGPKFFVHPTWHHAAQHAVLWPHVGFYGHYGDDGKHRGMFVAGVALKSIGHQIGIVPGDVILSIGGTPIDSPHAYMKAVRDADGDVTVGVWHFKTKKETKLTLNFDTYEPPSLKQNAASPTPRKAPGDLEDAH